MKSPFDLPSALPGVIHVESVLDLVPQDLELVFIFAYGDSIDVSTKVMDELATIQTGTSPLTYACNEAHSPPKPHQHNLLETLELAETWNDMLDPLTCSFID